MRIVKDFCKSNVIVIILVLVSVSCLSIVIISGCQKKEPVKIGFVGELTGRHSDLGVSGRKGAMQAVEEINASGGINGRPVELIIKNDNHDPKTALQVDKELIESKVSAIIGHMTSDMTMAVIDEMNKHNMLLISPTTSTPKLTKIDDYFISVMSTNKDVVLPLVNYAAERLKLKRIAAVYDITNQAYSKSAYNGFKEEFEKKGGEIAATEIFASGADVRFLEITQNLLKLQPDGIYLITGALDGAMFCQQLKKLESTIPVLSSGWAITNDFIEHGGAAVENVIFVHRFDTNSQIKTYLDFKERFKKQFGHDPDFAAVFAYEAAQVLFTGISKAESPGKVKEAIFSTRTFQGLQGDFTIDQYGDAHRKVFYIKVKNGKFEVFE